VRPKKPERTEEGDLFWARLDQIINLKHELVQLGGEIDWDWIDREIALLDSEGSAHDRKPVGNRAVCRSSTSTAFPTRTSASAGSTTRISSTSPVRSFSCTRFRASAPTSARWRKRLGTKLELLLAREFEGRAQQWRTAHARSQASDGGYHRTAITFPTDAAVLSAHRQAAGDDGRTLCPRQQFKRHRRQLRGLRIRLGRLVRDIGRKIAGQDELKAAFEQPLSRAAQIRSQQQRQREYKLYPFHAPEVECIARARPQRLTSSTSRPRSSSTNARPLAASRAARQGTAGQPV
jgi:IS5 family transposase